MLSFLKRLREYGPGTSLRYLYWRLRMLYMRRLRGSYSQLGEDLVMDELLGRRKHGFYVDVGANHPVSGNNTRRFHKRGWRGINVEPHPRAFVKLVSDRKNDVNLNVGLGLVPGVKPYFIFRASNMSTFSREEADLWVADGHDIEETRDVEVRTLVQVLDEHGPSGPIDIMSIDTQGWELEVLEGNDWARFRPRVLCVETGSGSRARAGRSPVDDYLSGLGYRKMHDNGVNSIYMYPG